MRATHACNTECKYGKPSRLTRFGRAGNTNCGKQRIGKDAWARRPDSSKAMLNSRTPSLKLNITCVVVSINVAASICATAAETPGEVSPPFLDDDEIRYHVVAAAPNGKPLWPHIRSSPRGFSTHLGDRGPANQKNDRAEYLNEYRDKYLKPMVANINRQAKGKKILIFIHGGMNAPRKSLRRSAILGAHPKLTKEYYPIFINWNSEPLSSYGEHLFLVRQGERHPVLGPITSPFVLVADLARALVRAPAVWVKLINSHFSRSEHRRTVYAQESLRYLRDRDPSRFPNVTKLSYREADERGPTQKFTAGTHNLALVLKAPAEIIIDAVGTGAWDMMLRRSRQLFDSPTYFKHEIRNDQRSIDRVVRFADSQRPGKRRDPAVQAKIDQELAALLTSGEDANPAKAERGRVNYLVRSAPGAVEMFLQELEKELEPGHSITLMGHSMGAIVANEILLRHGRKLPIDNIVYLAAACSVKESQDAIVPYLRYRKSQQKKAHFYNLSLHPIAEQSEAFLSPERQRPRPHEYVVASAGLLVPRGSLLVWLDSFFTHPVNLEDLRLGRWATAITSAGIFPQDVSDCVHLTMFPVGNISVPQKHGQFASSEFPTPFWDPSFWQPNAAIEQKAAISRAAAVAGDTPQSITTAPAR